MKNVRTKPEKHDAAPRSARPERRESAASSQPEVDLLALYRAMVTVRTLDERCLALQRQGRIGFYVPSTGQEATQVGAAFALEKEDWVYPSYRDPGVALVRGVPVVDLVHELFGNSKDQTLGRQMPVHYSLKKVNLVSISSPIATQIVQATGTAMAMKIRRKREVALTFFGDGATSANDFHTGLNFAGVFAAPCVFVCENNGWAISVPLQGQTAAPTIAAKAEAYGMPGVRVDGNDVLAVHAAVKQAVDRARAGHGPTLVEAVTFRMGPHSSSDDPKRYRDPALCEEWRKKDPIDRFHAELVRRKLWDESKEQALRASVNDEISRAVEEADRTAPPGVSTMFDDVFAERTPQLDEQWESLRDAVERGVVKKGHHGEFPL
jgi:2-oxoisovalerate dehydrogenase E1 component alpha subunit